MDPDSFAALFRATPTLSSFLPAADRAATSDSPILILGEPGSGRSTVARAFHRASRRRDGPLVVVDPGAVPSTLFESELFGHRAGAFTGAETSVEGRVARAEGGTHDHNKYCLKLYLINPDAKLTIECGIGDTAPRKTKIPPHFRKFTMCFAILFSI